MASTRDKIEQTLQEIYGCISGTQRESVIKSALLKMAYREDNEGNVLSSVMDAIDELEAPDVSPYSPSCIKIEASSDLIGWDDIENYLQEDHIEDFETRLAATERDRGDLDQTRYHKEDTEGYYRQPQELQGDDGVYLLESEYQSNSNRSYDPAGRAYTDNSVDPSNPRQVRELVIGLDNRKLDEGNQIDAMMDVWPPRTRSDMRAK